jgi:prepilin-type N-terminal cleavage/methylation domain-containing protein
MGLPRTSIVTRSEGFSLIEILIVIALLALITSVGIPALNNAFRADNESFARKMALLLREARDRAMLSDKLIRLRIDLENQQYWLEEAPSSYLLQKPPERGLSERERQEREEKEAGAFRQLTELTGDRVSMPKGLRIVEVITPRERNPIREGQVDVYFYHNGSADGVSIHFEDEENVPHRLTLHPVTGHSRLDGGAEERRR